MSDDNHVEPTPPEAADLAQRLFYLGMAGVGGFIAVVFIFIL